MPLWKASIGRATTSKPCRAAVRERLWLPVTGHNRSRVEDRSVSFVTVLGAFALDLFAPLFGPLLGDQLVERCISIGLSDFPVIVVGEILQRQGGLAPRSSRRASRRRAPLCEP